jgi:hypothetical protein
MFTENEIETFIQMPSVQEATFELKKDFIQNEVGYLEISDHDFLSLVMMAPSIGIALANGSVSLFEELALNKKARKMSKGGYFLKQDPVAHAMKYLIKNYRNWEEKFLLVIKVSMQETVFRKEVMDYLSKCQEQTDNFSIQLLSCPYVVRRYMTAFFLPDESEIDSPRPISQVELSVIRDLIQKLGLLDLGIFQRFLTTFQAK